MSTLTIRQVRSRSILLAATTCVVAALLLLAQMAEATPKTMLIGARAAMIVALLGLRAAVDTADEEGGFDHGR